MDRSYKTLEKLYYADASSNRQGNNKKQAQLRRESDSAFKTTITIETGEIFFIVPKELSLINEQVLKLERKVSSLWKKLPGVAQNASIRNLILAEIIETNEMEGVRSTKKQVMNAIDKAEKKSKAKHDLFVEFVLMYFELVNPESKNPETPEDIREIYDAVVKGTTDKKDIPDGRLFRASGVEITTKSNRTIHEGVNPEETIFFMLKEMISLANSDDYPQLYSAILSHFIFEYIHPFYDGNGRTGRYLLSRYLSTPLSLPTVLSLSKVIAENKEQYYRAFEITESPLNHAEATYFIILIMKLIKSAQDNLVVSLTKQLEQLEVATSNLASLEKNHQLADVECQILNSSIQIYLFGADQCLELPEVVNQTKKSWQTVRKYANKLETRNLIEVYGRKPLSFILTQTAKKELGLD